MTEPTKRQEYVLSLIVREYVKTPTPVGSSHLVERYALNMSAATIRNDMAALEELGLIHAPHTSAGRVPTEAGYRYFVQKLIGESELPLDEQRMIRHQFHQATGDLKEWLQLAASVLAQTARSAALITAPRVREAKFKHLELIGTQGRQVLLVLVLERGEVRQQMLTLVEPVAQPALTEAAVRIGALCFGLGGAALRAAAAHQPALEQEVMELVADMLDRAGTRHDMIYTGGLAHVLESGYAAGGSDLSELVLNPEQAQAITETDMPGARQTLHLLVEQSLLEDVLNDALSPGFEGVQVLIAGEGRWEELNHTSMILSNYGVKGQATGALGVLGPTRLHYGRAISAVRYVAGLMSDMLIDVYGAAGQD